MIRRSIRFCYIARGSLEETLSHLTFAHQMKYLGDETFQSLVSEPQEIRRMLNGYISFLKTSKRGVSEPGASVYFRESPAPYLEDSYFSEIGSPVSQSPSSSSPNP